MRRGGNLGHERQNVTPLMIIAKGYVEAPLKKVTKFIIIHTRNPNPRTPGILRVPIGQRRTHPAPPWTPSLKPISPFPYASLPFHQSTHTLSSLIPLPSLRPHYPFPLKPHPSLPLQLLIHHSLFSFLLQFPSYVFLHSSPLHSLYITISIPNITALLCSPFFLHLIHLFQL